MLRWQHSGRLHPRNWGIFRCFLDDAKFIYSDWVRLIEWTINVALAVCVIKLNVSVYWLLWISLIPLWKAVSDFSTFFTGTREVSPWFIQKFRPDFFFSGLNMLQFASKDSQLVIWRYRLSITYSVVNFDLSAHSFQFYYLEAYCISSISKWSDASSQKSIHNHMTFLRICYYSTVAYTLLPHSYLLLSTLPSVHIPLSSPEFGPQVP